MIRYQETTIDNVMNYYVNGFNLKEENILSTHWFVDTSKGVVVFKFVIDDLKREEN